MTQQSSLPCPNPPVPSKESLLSSIGGKSQPPESLLSDTWLLHDAIKAKQHLNGADRAEEATLGRQAGTRAPCTLLPHTADVISVQAQRTVHEPACRKLLGSCPSATPPAAGEAGVLAPLLLLLKPIRQVVSKSHCKFQLGKALRNQLGCISLGRGGDGGRGGWQLHAGARTVPRRPHSQAAVTLCSAYLPIPQGSGWGSYPSLKVGGWLAEPQAASNLQGEGEDQTRRTKGCSRS